MTSKIIVTTSRPITGLAGVTAEPKILRSVGRPYRLQEPLKSGLEPSFADENEDWRTEDQDDNDEGDDGLA